MKPLLNKLFAGLLFSVLLLQPVYGADTKISALTDGTACLSTDDIPVVRSAANRRCQPSAFQASNSNLTTYAGIAPSANVQTLLGTANFSAFRTSLGVAIGSNVQAWDTDLDTWATKTAPTGTAVGTTDTQTLTNKTLTSPIISTISNTGTVTLPTATDTLVGKATTDTLTNKTISGASNTLSSIATSSLATVQGNGSKVQLSTGTTTTNNCVKFDANGNTVDAGSACGSGSGSSSVADLRNFIFNGKFQIDQPNEFNSVTLTSGGTVWWGDQWLSEYQSSATGVTTQIVADAPSGFNKSLKVTVGTAGTIAATDYLAILADIEAIKMAPLNYGTSLALPTSISFWVKASITGTYSATIVGGVTGSFYVSDFTVSSANTWELKTINNIPGQSTGDTWQAAPGQLWGHLYVSLCMGSTYKTASVNTWVVGGPTFASNSITNTMLTTSGSTFQITGVQWEQAATASAFQQVPYEMDLATARRYYQKSFPLGTKPAQNAGVTGAYSVWSQASASFGQTIPFNIPMASAPTITLFNPSATNGNWRDATNSADRTATIGTISTNGFIVSGASGVASANNLIQWVADKRL